jgi:serine phosphatase RsbU (regulator of sigma subunit)
VRSHRDRQPRDIMGALFVAVSEFSRGHAQIDDMTAVILKATSV